MSIIETPQTPSNTVALTVEQIKRMNFRLYQQILTIHTQIFQNVWNNPTFTPKQIIEGFGTDAAALFINSANIQTLLYSVNNSYVPLNLPAGVNITFNPDGSPVYTQA